MICIHEDVLRQVGLDEVGIRAVERGFSTHGVLPSPSPGFNQAGDTRPMGLSAADWLRAEPSPRRILLVGVDDRHGSAVQVAGQGNVTIVHLAADGAGPARLSPEDIERLPGVMRPFGWRMVDRALAAIFERRIGDVK